MELVEAEEGVGVDFAAEVYSFVRILTLIQSDNNKFENTLLQVHIKRVQPFNKLFYSSDARLMLVSLHESHLENNEVPHIYH